MDRLASANTPEHHTTPMSIDINWETLTGGPDGAALAESIRAFIHDKFQKVALPRMIRSVQVHSFDFGTVPPTIELKDVCDPLPDFYDDETEHEGQTPDADGPSESHQPVSHHHGRHEEESRGRSMPPNLASHQHAFPDPRLFMARHGDQIGSPILSRAPTPGILGGTSNLGYFHLPLSAGLSGTATPLAAVAGAQFQNQPQFQNHQHYNQRHAGESDNTPSSPPSHHRSASFSSSSPPSVNTPSSRPTSGHVQDWANSDASDRGFNSGHSPYHSPARSSVQERSGEDVQIVAHVSYSGDIKLSLTAEILLDYPMPSFVGIPLKLNITGLTFDGVALIAYIKRKANFCFLCPEDADALIGSDVDLRMAGDDNGPAMSSPAKHSGVGALLEEIKVESEIGQQENGKSVLKNVGKVEKFVLEQVRRIFEDEFVYPSYWTFLV
ncbi:Mitochondrial distribution and morphology protein 12 [Zalaria obscura]|uniref:Mitochondrial distribution and morphology protein 12 n=1 Tax=Zalaria obscura TaxID=2024903 RepID=A0ACC3S4Q2_9PEZI